MKIEYSFDELVQSRIYGPHRIDSELSTSGITYCSYGCGCYWSKEKKGGPIGLDSVASSCPNNPLNGQKLPENLDYEIVVKQRFDGLYKALSDTNSQNEKFVILLGKIVEEALKPDASMDEIRKMLKIIKSPKK